MNLLVWMVAGMAIGCFLMSAGRRRNDVALLVGLLAGAAGAVVAGVWATDETVATKLFGQSFSAFGLLAAVVGAAAFAVVLRLLWHPGKRSESLAAMDEIAAKPPGASARGTKTFEATTNADMHGDTQPAAFDGRQHRVPRNSAAPDSSAKADVRPGLGQSKRLTDPS